MSNEKAFDPYDVLGVPRDADRPTIKRAYRRKAKAVHPDSGAPRAHWDDVARAYGILTDETRRGRYDRTGDPGEEAGPDNILTHAGEAIEAIATALVTEILVRGEDVANVDMMHRIKTTIEAKIAVLIVQKDEGERTLKQLERMRKRLKFKGRGSNRIEIVLKGRSTMIGQFIARSETDIEIHTMALKLLADYDYQWDDPQADMARQMTRKIESQFNYALNFGLGPPRAG